MGWGLAGVGDGYCSFIDGHYRHYYARGLPCLGAMTSRCIRSLLLTVNKHVIPPIVNGFHTLPFKTHGCSQVRSVGKLPHTFLMLRSSIKYPKQVWESFRANSGLEGRLLDGVSLLLSHNLLHCKVSISSFLEYSIS